MIIGAGGAGRMLIQEILSTDKIVMNPVCLIDDDKNKKGSRIEGVKVVGTTQDIKFYAEKYKIQMITNILNCIFSYKLPNS